MNTISKLTKTLAIVWLLATGLTSCTKDEKKSTNCGDFACDASEKSLSINFVDKEGVGVPVSNYSVINLRTNDTIHARQDTEENIPGRFIVLSDSYRSKLSVDGDDIKITGTHTKTKQTKSVIIKVSNPKCACHFEKMSGAEIIKFD